MKETDKKPKPKLEIQPGGRGALKRDAGPGRPKGSLSIIEEIKRKLNQNPELLGQLTDRVIQLAMEGNPHALKQIMDRIDGPIAEKLEHLGGQTIRVVFDELPPPDPDA